MTDVDFLVVGAGPAGMLTATLLARAGFDVAVLEKAAGLRRSFRGESVSPDSVRILRDLGVLAQVPDGAMRTVLGTTITDDGSRVLTVDFDRLLPGLELPAEIPQDTLLAAVHAVACAPETPGTVDVRFGAKVTALEFDGGRVAGVRYQAGRDERLITAGLTIAADGRYSTVRDIANIEYDKNMLARDFLWMKVTAPSEWDSDRYHVRINRSDHVVCIPTVPDMVRLGVNIPQGGIRDVRERGFDAFRDQVAAAVPELSDALRAEVTGWRDTSMLDIFTTEAERWSVPGLVLIGDAAHTMTPVLAQGVNNAIVDALVLTDELRAATAPGAVDPATADAAALRFAELRRPHVDAARATQLRQEHLFELRGLGAVVRRLVYRIVDHLPPVQRRIWTPVYYALTDAANPASAALRRWLEVVPPTTAERERREHDLD
ncbi:FAD-binding protein [Rhodococcus rhodnii]|uniref:FAD-binding domain-containing protein n=2 Tax=Rhodococcus rhodnii TaxID=38312 RepID=R7WPL9_9NOCA|nr:FAD-dependent monooxygenase [Rhodococcus rhodnii]EOM77253.1 hypothetical protein Rrhod_1402 [Rhodococcus rhodnii LMG 5362]TXG90161.1 FAD-binding protein [Rhodococcus rhodnii]